MSSGAGGVGEIGRGGQFGGHPDVVLALLSLNYRAAWQEIYTDLSADPRLFQSTLRDALDTSEWPGSVWLSGKMVALPREFVEYLRGPGSALLSVAELAPYVSATESTWSTDPSVLEAQTIVSRLRRSMDELSSHDVGVGEAASIMPRELDRLSSLIAPLAELFGRPGALHKEIASAISSLTDLTSEIFNTDDVDASERSEAFVLDWTARGNELLDQLDGRLRELRRYVSVVGVYSRT